MQQATAVKDPELQQNQSSQEQTVENVLGAYCAILLGCVCIEHRENEAVVRNALEMEGGFPALIAHLEDFVYFQQGKCIWYDRC